MPEGQADVRKPLEEDDRKARLRRGKLNVRFDEGELEIGHSPLRQLSTLPKPFTPDGMK